MFNNKVLLNWKEPLSASHKSKEKISWKQIFFSFGKLISIYSIGGLAVGVIIFLLASVRHGFGNVDVFPILIFIACGSILGLVFGLTGFLNATISPNIYLREKDILIIAVSGSENIPYETIKSYSINKEKLEEIEFQVLEFNFRDGSEVFIEIAPQVNVNEISQILKSKNVQLKHSLNSST